VASTPNNYKGFVSKYSGQEIDKAVEAALNAKDTIAHVLLKTSEEKKADLNDLLTPKVYRIEYYIHGYNDESTERPIDLSVKYIDENTIEQSYTDGDYVVVRTYDVLTQTFSDWDVDSSGIGIISASINDNIEVKKPTLVLRYTE
jgi:hypothetical protein